MMFTLNFNVMNDMDCLLSFRFTKNDVFSLLSVCTLPFQLLLHLPSTVALSTNHLRSILFAITTTTSHFTLTASFLFISYTLLGWPLIPLSSFICLLSMLKSCKYWKSIFSLANSQYFRKKRATQSFQLFSFGNIHIQILAQTCGDLIESDLHHLIIHLSVQRK